MPAHGVEDAGLQMAEFDDLRLFAGLGCVAWFHRRCGFEAGGLADGAVGVRVRGDAGGDDEVVVFAGFEIGDVGLKNPAKLFSHLRCDSGNGDV